MSKRIVTAVALIGVAGVISGCSLDQPSAGCIVQDSTDYPWQALYTPKAGDETKACGKLVGEALGVWKYVEFEKGANEQLTKKRAYLGIRPEGLANLFAPYSYEDEVLNADGTVKVGTDGKPVMETKEVQRVAGARADNYAVAKAATALSETLADEPVDGLCATTGFKPATVKSDAVVVVHENDDGETETIVPEERVSYNFSNVQVYSDPSAPGTQLKATLTYTTKEGDASECVAEYEVNAMWPQTGCDPESKDVSETCGAGSGINPDFAVRCEPKLANTIIKDFDDDDNPIFWKGACVLAKTVPSFK